MLLDLPVNLSKKTVPSRQKLKKTLSNLKKMKENCETIKKSKRKSCKMPKMKPISKKASTTMTTQSKTFMEELVEPEESLVQDHKSPNEFYLERLFETYKKQEETFAAKECLKHHQIDENIRGKMVDWMIEVLFSLQCSEDSLFLAVNVMDRFLATTTNMKVHDLHLVGIVCIFIASKYEEVFPIKLDTIFSKVAHGKFSKNDLKDKELEILETLDFKVFGPILNKMLAVTVNRMISQGLIEGCVLGLFEKAVAYFGKMVLYDYNLIAKKDLRPLVSGILYTAFKLVETVFDNVDFQSKVQICKDILSVEMEEMSEISNDIFLLTQRFDQTYPNNNLKKVSVDFYLEMKEKRRSKAD